MALQIQSSSSQLQTIHPSIHFLYPLNPSVGSRGGARAYPSGHRARGGVHPRQVASPSQTRQTTTHMLTLTPKDNLVEKPSNLTCLFLDGWRKLEYPERTHAYTGRTCKLHTDTPSRDLNLEPSCCEETVVTTTPPCSPNYKPIFCNLIIIQFIKFQSTPIHTEPILNSWARHWTPCCLPIHPSVYECVWMSRKPVVMHKLRHAVWVCVNGWMWRAVLEAFWVIS